MSLALKKLQKQHLSDLSISQPVLVPQYDISNTTIGIVHLGPGAFHRAHQAVYTENVMNSIGGNWGICGVSLRSAGARDILAKQDNLYTLAVLDKTVNYQVIGALKEVLVASEEHDLVLARMSAESTKLITLTITEKGYCLAADGALDINHRDIQHDLSEPSAPVSAIGFIVEALKQRRLNNIPAFNVLSCDNVSGNGEKLQRAVLGYAGLLDKSLQAWISEKVAFPNSMVDSITPKTENYTVEAVSSAINLHDEWPIQREEFTQWVIDNNWQGERPEWEKVGVIFTNDVEGFEKAKLRLLNCLHSTLAYAGSLAGFETVFEAISDEHFYHFITQLASEEIIGSFLPPEELAVESYANDIIQRFLNPNIRHLLAQIAFDGSQKIQMRILPVIEDNLALNRSIKLLCLSLCSWFEFICQALNNNEKINDPMANVFSDMADLLSSDVEIVITAFLSIDAIFNTSLASNKKLKKQLINSLTVLRNHNIKQIDKLAAML